MYYPINNDSRLIYISAVISVTLHVLLLLSYFKLNKIQKENLLLLENVEIIEIEPDAPLPPPELIMPAQTPPKSVIDFIKMAFTPKKQDFKEVAEQLPKEKTIKEITEEKIDLSKKFQAQDKPQISLDEKKFEKNAQLSEIVDDLSNKKQDMSMLTPDEPAIDLSEVGRVAVKLPPAEMIDIGNRKLNKDNLKDVEVKQVAKAYQRPVFQEKAISQEQVTARRTTGYSNAASASIGYSKGFTKRIYVRKEDQELKKVSESAVQRAESKKLDERVKEAKVSKKAVEIMGPVTKRKIIRSYLPVYPAWARAQSVEADVVIRFFVAPDGTVREKLMVERTSGYGELDSSALEAIKKWVFESVDASQGDQWGVITFRYILE